MQRIGLAVLISFTLLSCSREAPTKPQVNPPVAEVEKPVPPPVVVAPPAQVEGKQPEPPQPKQETNVQEKYDAAFQGALALLGQGKYEQALQAMQEAQALQDSEFIKSEIARLKSRIDQETAAKKTIESIEAVLAQGKGKDGADLADAALKQFGGTDAAEKLIKLKLQAEALASTQQ